MLAPGRSRPDTRLFRFTRGGGCIVIVWLSILALVLAVAGGALLVGARLPVTHRARVRTTLHQPVETVWKALVDFPGYASWRRGLVRVEHVGEAEQSDRWREFDRRGGRMTFETVETVAPTRLVRRIADRDLPFGGTWTFVLEGRGGDETAVVIEEQGEVYNPLFRFVSKFIMGHHATMVAFVEDLGRRFGETPDVYKE